MESEVSPTELPQPLPRESVLTDLFSRWRVVVFGLFLVIEFAIYFGAIVYPVPQASLQSYQQQVHDIQSTVSGESWSELLVGIFANNVKIALFELVPLLGAFVFAYSIFVTGQVTQVIAMSANPPLPGTLVGSVLFLTSPFAILEFLAYVVASVSGSMLVVAWRRKRLRREARVFALEALLVVAILITSAGMEVLSIRDFVAGLALWFPAVLISAGLFLLVRRRLAR